ncbi:MAG: tetratricopeptide repeat protein, partial [Bacilli bacterium]|nr:tetratricopeptide repeat protein [Bacilli bacterium]
MLALGATEAAYMALNNNLNDNHFATIKEETVDDEEVSYSIDTKSTKIGDIFYDALKCGDLLTVEKIITTENWDNFRDKMNNANLRLLKKLLSFMHEHMALIREREDERDILSSQKVPQELLDRSNALAYDLLSEKERMDYKKVELLRKLGSLVKRQNYTASLGEILESDVDVSKDDKLLDITSDILVAKEGIKTEAHSLFEEFNKALQEKDTKLASEKLIEYSGYITSKSIDRDLAYHRKRIDIVEKDMKQANFEEKERLYSNALEMFYNKDKLNRLQKIISILNYYIELDNNINSKGYLLRARAYEKLKRIEEAKADYQKALQISPEPLALRALGKYAYEEGDYERAIYYLEKFQAIRPFKDEKVSRMLVTSYNSTGKEEKSLPFNRHLKHLNYIS